MVSFRETLGDEFMFDSQKLALRKDNGFKIITSRKDTSYLPF